MFWGTVTFRARIQGYGLLKLPSVEFNPGKPGVEKVTIEGPDGDEICTTVYLDAVASHDDWRKLAKEVHKEVLDRIAFNYALPIENGYITHSQVADTGTVSSQCEAGFFVARDADAAHLKAELVQASPPGERHYGLFRSALQSSSPVEEFMYLYHILLMLCNQQYQDEKQSRVDKFIKSEDSKVLETPDPRKPKVMETVYTRLRNELGHKRDGVNLENTKCEMGHWLPGLIALTQRAIALYP